MPHIDGFEFIARLRALPIGRDVPILVWTVKDLDPDERRRLLSSTVAIASKNADGARGLIDELRRLLPDPPARPSDGDGI